MTNSLLVTADCPSCGAPLDFHEGSNAVRCEHCGTNLLVTGRKQVVSYLIRPSLDVHRGVARAMMANKESGRPCRMILPKLYFLPYYRFTGHDFRWERKPQEKRETESAPDPEVMAGLSEEARFLARTASSRNSQFDSSGVLFAEQTIEKNFIGCEKKELGLYSLGIRPAVLKLELFGKKEIEEKGEIIGPDLSSGDAFAKGLKIAGGESLLDHSVLGGTLSLIFFPFWVMEVEVGGERSLTVLDAVSESVLQVGMPLAFRESLVKMKEGEAKSIQFRPLVCPNCGWDFPVRKEDVILFCGSCRKAWQIGGDSLSEVPHRILEPRERPEKGGTRYLPVWILDADQSQSGIGRFYLPGFRYRRLKALADLSRALSQKKVSIGSSEEKEIEGAGCFYDQNDALQLARFVDTGITHQSAQFKMTPRPDQFKAEKIELAWYPFQEQGEMLIEPLTGLSLSRSLLG